MTDTSGPHQGQPVKTAGMPLDRARAAMILVHGRGGTPENLLAAVPALGHPEVAYLAPSARGNSWYPNSFLAPIPSNEPGISSGMQVLRGLLEHIAAAGVPPERTMLLGFSQGACLSSEFVARHARRYGGLAVLSGGLIGPDGTQRDYAGSLDGTPVFLGCSDVDAHIPKQRVEQSAEVLRALGGAVDMRIYPGMGHTISEEEMDAVRAMMDAL